jgi:hypothetical protein
MEQTLALAVPQVGQAPVPVCVPVLLPEVQVWTSVRSKLARVPFRWLCR